MAEVEVGGITFKGGKIFLLLTVLSTLGGGAWGATRDARGAIASAVAGTAGAAATGPWSRTRCRRGSRT